MLRIPAIVAGALFAASLPAQLTISDANMEAFTDAPSAASQLPREFDLRADALAVDHGFEHWWYYRVAGDVHEFALSDNGGLSSGVTSSGDHADRDYADLDARGLLKASVDMDIYAAGSASGVVISRMTLMNISSGPLTVDAFGYTDVDVAGTSGNDVCFGTADRHYVTDPSGVQIDIRGLDATGSDVRQYPTLRGLLSNNQLDNLGNALPPFTGDYTGAFQWTVTLQPFEQRTFTIVIAVDTVASVPPLVEHYGAGNGSSFEVHANDLPLQDVSTVRSFSVRMKGAAPNRVYRIGTSLQSWAAQPFIPAIDLWIDPLAIIGVYAGFTDANGEAALTFGIPPSPYLTGFSVYSQCLYVDAGAPNGFAYWTPGLRTRIGKL